jgi:organic radical activating enzyme
MSPDWEGFVDEGKVVGFEFLEGAAAERLAAAHPGAVVSIQPEFGGDRASIERAVALVMSHPEWRLSLQPHKFLGIR